MSSAVRLVGVGVAVWRTFRAEYLVVRVLTVLSARWVVRDLISWCREPIETCRSHLQITRGGLVTSSGTVPVDLTSLLHRVTW